MNDALVNRITSDSEVFGIAPLLFSADHIIVGFSGGADSSLLLSYLKALRDSEKDFPTVSALHVNHMLRGAESDSDEAFCRGRCEELGVPLAVRRINIPEMMAESGSGAEECARLARYGAFAEEKAKYSGQVLVATAHNADDNLETVLFNLARGGGASGLAGIPPVRNGYVIRPLLGLGADEIRRSCEENGIPFVVDSTNKDEEYTRNYIRHSIVPLLKKVNPEAAGAAVRAGINLREDESLIVSLAEAAVGEYLPDFITDSVEIPRKSFLGIAPAVQSRAVAMAVASVTDVRMSAGQVRACRHLITRSGTGKVSLPDAVTLEVSKNLVTVSRKNTVPKEFSFDIDLPTGDDCVKYSSPEAGFDLYISRREESLPLKDENIYKLSINTAVRFDTIYGKVYARNRMPGDTLFLGGITRKLKKMICDRGIPESMRHRLPVICDDEGVLAVPGLPVRGPAYARECDYESNVLHVMYCLYWRF